MKILITGSAGFIGFSIAKKILNEKKYHVIGIDNINNYYDPNLKKVRLSILNSFKNYKHYNFNIAKKDKVDQIFKKYKFSIVIHLAAQAGVRYSIDFPEDYINTNLVGFFNIINASKIAKVKKFIYASSSSVYGNQSKFPIKENFDSSKPMSIYAATKKANELMAYSYSSLHGIETIGLRFFTVYGPFGRPDMSLFKFTKSIIENKTIKIFNYGNHFRDFTYIDDVVDAIKLVFEKKSKNKENFKVYNVANGKSINLKLFLNEIEKYFNKKGKIKNLKLQQGDVTKTHANIKDLINDFGYMPKTSYKEGIKKFIDWYIDFYKL